MSRVALTQLDFIARANACHNNKYDYSKSVYVGTTSKITVTCPLHGDWQVLASQHIRTSGHGATGCPMCSGRKAQTPTNANGGGTAVPVDVWIAQARSVHGDTYDYSNVCYTNSLKRVTIGCPLHGLFSTTPNNHIHKKTGCPICAGKLQGSVQIFVIRAQAVHGQKYNYALVDKFDTAHDVVTIGCPIHGNFKQAIKNHLHGNGCTKCGNVSTGLKQRGIKRRKMLTPTI